MVLYDYRCRGCASLFEVSRPMTDLAPVTCRRCGDGAQRVPSAVALAGARPAVGPRSSLPTTLRGLGGGRETLRDWRRQEERISHREERDGTPARLPFVSHEGPAGPVVATPRAVGQAPT